MLGNAGLSSQAVGLAEPSRSQLSQMARLQAGGIYKGDLKQDGFNSA